MRVRIKFKNERNRQLMRIRQLRIRFLFIRLLHLLHVATVVVVGCDFRYSNYANCALSWAPLAAKRISTTHVILYK